MKTFAILNPSHRHQHWKEIFAKIGLPRGWVNRELPDGLERMVKSGLQAGVEKFVVVGGDGTFSRVVNALVQSQAWDLVLELVPGGTCNDFTRYLYGKKFKYQPDRAAEIQAVDLASLNGKVFLNNAGFGRRPRQGSRQSAWRTALGFEPVRIQARWHDGSLSGHFFMAMACNGPFFNKGLFFSRTVSASDGILDFFFVRPMNPWKALTRLALGRLGRPLAPEISLGQERFGVRADVVSTRAYQMMIETDQPVWPQLDGEPFLEATKKIMVEILSKKLKIAVPKAR